MLEISVKKKAALFLYYFLSWTWGLPMSLTGAAVLFVLRLCGKRIRRFGLCFYAEIGKDWGGLELGMFFLKDTSPHRHIYLHEAGHSIQNICYGPLMPFLITLPSAARYWYREIRRRRGITPATRYEDIWFEAQATRWGYRCFAGSLPPSSPATKK